MAMNRCLSQHLHGKSSVNAAIWTVGMLLSSHTIKSLHSIEKIQPRMTVAMFNDNRITAIIFSYNPTNASNETYLITFCNELSFLAPSVSKHNVLIIGGDMNAQIGKNVTNKFSLHSLSNRNGEHPTDFPLDGLTCFNTKFSKSKGKLWTYSYANNAKAQIDYILIYKIGLTAL